MNVNDSDVDYVPGGSLPSPCRRGNAPDSPDKFLTLQHHVVARHRVLALPMQGGVCDVCHCPPSSEVAMLFDANDNPTVALCVDCAAACIRVALGVKMTGLVLQWRTQAAIKAERIARDEAAKAQRRNQRRVENASE